MCHTESEIPDARRTSTTLASAGLDTATRHEGHWNAYELSYVVEHNSTRTSRVVSSTSPQVGQLARIIAIVSSLRFRLCLIALVLPSARTSVTLEESLGMFPRHAWTRHRRSLKSNAGDVDIAT